MSALIPVVVGLALGVGVPWLGMRMFAPSLAASPARTNFRGREVHLGLGVVWVLWSGGAMAAALLLSGGDAGPMPGGLLILAGPLALATFALGFVDDALGSSADRGFRGHLKALAKGRLTTGMLKLLGISAASLVVAGIASGFAPWGRAYDGTVWRPVLTVVAGAAIALTSNLLNLLDLRPGRALKSYGLLGLVGAAVATLMRPSVYENGVDLPLWEYAAGFAVLGLFALGPVFAVWREDLGERAMLGDAGANPAGAVAGLLIVAGLPVWGLLGYFVLVLALNLASERWSFTRVIEGNSVLRYLDGLGRLPTDPPEIGDSAKSSPQSETSDG